MDIKETYEKYKHLGQMFCDRSLLPEDEFMSNIIFDLWQAIKPNTRTGQNTKEAANSAVALLEKVLSFDICNPDQEEINEFVEYQGKVQDFIDSQPCPSGQPTTATRLEDSTQIADECTCHLMDGGKTCRHCLEEMDKIGNFGFAANSQICPKYQGAGIISSGELVQSIDKCSRCLGSGILRKA